MRPRFYLISVLFVLLGFGCSDGTSPAEPSSEVDIEPKIIDLHAHIYPVSEELNDAYVDDLVATAQANGVSKIVLGLNARQVPERPPTYSTDHDQWVLAAAARYPEVIIPALNGFDPADPEAVDYVSEQLATGQWKIIGELDLRNKVKQTTTPANDSTLMQIYQMAAEYDVPVMFHFDAEYGTDRASGEQELEEAIAQNPDTIFINGHSCGSQIVDLMKTYANLYCEQEFVPIAPGIDMNRVVLGTDMQVHANAPSQAADEYEQLIARLRDSIAGWDTADQARAALETPTDLLNL